VLKRPDSARRLVDRQSASLSRLKSVSILCEFSQERRSVETEQYSDLHPRLGEQFPSRSYSWTQRASTSRSQNLIRRTIVRLTVVAQTGPRRRSLLRRQQLMQGSPVSGVCRASGEAMRLSSCDEPRSHSTGCLVMPVTWTAFQIQT
jgi:hypothetical protein